MEFLSELNLGSQRKPLQRMSRCVFAIGQARGNVDVPFRKSTKNRSDPFTNAGFPRVDFLTATNQTHDYRPIGVTIEARYQELRFGLVEVGNAFLSEHESC